MSEAEGARVIEPAFAFACSVDSDTGTLTDILLGRPDHFEWRRSISAISERSVVSGLGFDRELAIRQHVDLVELLRAHDVNVHFLPTRPELPYCVFARDSSFMTPFGPVLSLMMNPVRRGDYSVALAFYGERGIPFWHMMSAGHCEGGDVAILEPGTALIGQGGLRTDAAGANQLKGWFEKQGWEAIVVEYPAHFIHLDLIFVMLAPKLAAVCVEAHRPEFLDLLEARGVEILEVSYGEAMQCGCNLLGLGVDRVLSTKNNEAVNERMRARGLTVLAPDLSMFTAGGGGPHCLSQVLKRASGP